ncbi:ABC transporter permease [Amycolatopsis sp. GM8]|uniref:ABC transporter permease n=1 Tax=Amycolatopsis sp. GM8 TaxID=2896530 RepID=UPI001F2001EB|nr:ABC transporter permease [Amycolatopsis sp. GM8]
MPAYILRRFAALIPVLLTVFTAVFLVVHLAPGSPASVILGQEATPQQITQLNSDLGLDQPLWQQYATWIGHAVTGDLGQSYFLDAPVLSTIVDHVPPTLSLALIAEIIGIGVAIPLGIIAATRRGSLLDRVILNGSLVGISVPSFLLALFLLLVFGVWLRVLPVGGYEPLSSGFFTWLSYLILPGIALGGMQAALITRMARSSVLEVLGQEYIKVAKAKGLRTRVVVLKHALRNAFLPVLTILGQGLGSLITGAVVTETIFTIPGIGTLVVNSVLHRDFPVVQGTVLFTTVIFVLVNLIVDLLYGVFDPRVKLPSKR